MKAQEKQLTCIDLFCGCGGLSKGFQLSGFDVVGGIDFNVPAVATYAKNFPSAQAVCCDLMEMEPETIVKEFPYENIDVVIGGPPCQGFSTANRYADEERRDPRNKLFFQFVKFVDLFSPKAVVIENVRGILTMNKGYAKKRIESIFKSRGYHVVNCVLNAADYGVPQRRFRNFFVMLKDGVFDFDRLKKVAHCPTVQEAIGEFYSHEGEEMSEVSLVERPQTDYQKYLRDGQKIVRNHEVRYPAKKVQDTSIP